MKEHFGLVLSSDGRTVPTQQLLLRNDSTAPSHELLRFEIHIAAVYSVAKLQRDLIVQKQILDRMSRLPAASKCRRVLERVWLLCMRHNSENSRCDLFGEGHVLGPNVPAREGPDKVVIDGVELIDFIRWSGMDGRGWATLGW